MKDEFDVEAALRRYDAGPSERAKKSVMDRFRRTVGVHAVGRAGFWRRPVPLYRVAIAAIIFIGLSFVAGREFSKRPGGRSPDPDHVPASPASTGDEFDWVPAESDCL